MRGKDAGDNEGMDKSRCMENKYKQFLRKLWPEGILFDEVSVQFENKINVFKIPSCTMNACES